ncbi:MAG: tyrosine-protein phosphatase [Mangrovicoccus sp.]|nr:tyrosine-protein phosphatase [Mangrovicoccus sp.]
MLATIKSRLRHFEHDMRQRFGVSIATPKERRQAWWHFQLMDHAFLRVLWWNLDEFASGAWRANQPSPRQLERYAQMGIRTILNLRGEGRYSHFLFEEEACARHGLKLISLTFSARKLSPRADMLELIETMREIEKPFLVHCKSGSDRTGLAAALYLAIIEGRPVAEARRQLHWRFLHLSSTDTGILDHIFDVYEEDVKTAPMSLLEWLETRYDHEALTASWQAKRR